MKSSSDVNNKGEQFDEQFEISKEVSRGTLGDLITQLADQLGSFLDSGHFASIDESIVSERDLSYYGLKVPIIIIQSIMYLFFLVGFVYLSYQQAVSNVFLSPYTPNASHCETIPITNNGKFIIDWDGIWEGQPGFNPIKAQYEVTFASLNIDETEWVKVIDGFRVHVKETFLRSLAMKDKAFNLIVFSSYSYHVVHGDGTIDIHFTGDASVMFDKYIYNAIGYMKYTTSTNGGGDDDVKVCQPHKAKAHYSASSSNLDIDIPLIPGNLSENLEIVPYNGIDLKLHDLTAPVLPRSPCPGVLDFVPESYDYEFAPMDWTKTTISYDMRSVSTVIAVNSNILSLEALMEFGQEKSFDFMTGGEKSLRMMVDAEYPGMDPIVCSFTWKMCGVLDGLILRIPVILEGGSYNDATDFQYPHTCPYPAFDCNEADTYTQPQCTSMNLNIAFVKNDDPAVDGTSFYYNSEKLFKSFSTAPVKDISTFLGYSRGFFSAMSSFDPSTNDSPASITAYNDAVLSLLDDYFGSLYSPDTCGDVRYRATTQRLMRSICNTLNCTWIYLAMAPSSKTYITDYLTEGYRINKKNTYVPFVNSSKKFISESAIEGMQKPPINLIQSYMKCTQSPSEAFISAVGIAFANTTIVTRLLYIVLLYISIKVINNFLHTGQKTQALNIYDKKNIYRTTTGILFKEIIENSPCLKGNKDIEQLWVLLQAFDDHNDANSSQSGGGGAYMKYLASEQLLPLHFTPKAKKKPQKKMESMTEGTVMTKAKGQVQLSNLKVHVSPVDHDDGNTYESSNDYISEINRNNGKKSSNSSSNNSSYSYDTTRSHLGDNDRSSYERRPYNANIWDVQNVEDA